MLDRIIYYIDLVIALCGFDGSDDFQKTGMVLVVMALLIVVYTFYVAVIKMIWPQENIPSHIKFSILESDVRVEEYEN